MADIFARLIRGVIGVVLVIGGIMNGSWIGLFGVIFLMTAVTGRCGFGATSCEVKPKMFNWDKKEE